MLKYYQMKARFISILLISLPFYLPAQNRPTLRAQTIALADSLAKIGKVEIKSYECTNPLAKRLVDSSEIAELLALTRYAHPAVRVYAWAGLLRRKDVSNELMLQVLRERWHDSDTVLITYTEDQFQSPIKVLAGDYFLRSFKEGHFSGLLAIQVKRVFKPDATTVLKFDSLLICDPPPFQDLQIQTLMHTKPNPNWYDCARRQVLDGSNFLMEIYLSKFKKEADIDLIINHLLPKNIPGDHYRPRWLPFVEFQHPRLFQVLKDSAMSNLTDADFLRAVKKYKNREAADLIDSTFCRLWSKSPKKWQLESTVCMAIQGEFDTVFADVLIKILCLAPENTNCKVPDKLWECRPDTLAALYEIWKKGDRGARERATAMFPQYEKWLSRKGSEKTVSLVMEQIKPGGEYRNFQKAFAAILKTRGSTVFVEALFNFMEKEPLPENRFLLAKLLLELQAPEVKLRLEKLFAEKPALRPTLAAAEKAGSTFSDFLYHAQNDKD